MMDGIEKITSERQRVLAMGRTPESDCEGYVDDRELLRAAAYKLIVAIYGEEQARGFVGPDMASLWPWLCIEPGGDCSDRERLIIEAGQLCAAALDRGPQSRLTTRPGWEMPPPPVEGAEPYAHHDGEGWILGWIDPREGWDALYDDQGHPVAAPWPFGEDQLATGGDLEALGFTIV